MKIHKKWLTNKFCVIFFTCHTGNMLRPNSQDRMKCSTSWEIPNLDPGVPGIRIVLQYLVLSNRTITT